MSNIETPTELRLGKLLLATVTPPVFTGVGIDDWNFSGKQFNRYVRMVNTGGNMNVTGMLAPSPKVPQFLTLHLVSGGRVRFTHNDVSSDPDNRWLTPGGFNLDIQALETALAVYDIIDNRWVIIGGVT